MFVQNNIIKTTRISMVNLWKCGFCIYRYRLYN